MLILQTVAALLMAGGLAYLLLALFHVWHHRWPVDAVLASPAPPVTVMIPVHGLTPRLAACLDSVYAQDYDDFQVVFGLHSPDDPARPVIEDVMAAHPHLDSALVINGHRIGANPKNCNLANMMAAVKHDILVMVDSDVLVEPDFLRHMVAALRQPGVGGVTCLYTADPQGDLASRLGALYLNDWFVPSVLVDIRLHELDLCYGAAIAVTGTSLRAIGGFAAMGDAVAQDFVFGHRLREAGFTLRLASTVVRTVVAETSLGALLRHELRWNRAVRAVRPLDHALSVFMHPLLPGGLTMLLTWPPYQAIAAITLYLALRLSLHALLLRRFRIPGGTVWLLPLRELLNIGVWFASFLGRRVQWGEQVLVTGKGLSMHRSDRETVG